MDTNDERAALERRIEAQRIEVGGAQGQLAAAEDDLQSAAESGADDRRLGKLQGERDEAARRLERASLRLTNLVESERPALERMLAEQDSEATRQELTALGEEAAAAYARVAELLSEIEATLEPLDRRRVADAYHAIQRLRNTARQHGFEAGVPKLPSPPDGLRSRLHAVLGEAVARLDYAGRCFGA